MVLRITTSLSAALGPVATSGLSAQAGDDARILRMEDVYQQGVLPRLIGSSPTYEGRQDITANIAAAINKFPGSVIEPDTEGRYCELIRPDGRRLKVEALKVTRFPSVDHIVCIGDRWYKMPDELRDMAKFDIGAIISEPALWIGNASLVHFVGIESVARDSAEQSGIELFWDGDIPPNVRSPEKQDAQAMSAALSFLADQDPCLRLHAVISLVRKNWLLAGPVSLQYLDSLQLLGPEYLHQGIRTALGLTHLSPSIWPSDWEDNLILLLRKLNSAAGIRNIKIDLPLETPVEQRVFAARLGYRLQSMPIGELYPEHISQGSMTGELFRVPVRVEGETLVIRASELLSKPFVRAAREEPNGNMFDFPLPNPSKMVLDGLLQMARHGINPAEKYLNRIRSPAARHYSASVTGYRFLAAREVKQSAVKMPMKIGLIRGGFGPGGAAQEAQNLLNRLADYMLPLGAEIFVASGFFHEGTVLPRQVKKTMIPQVDRQKYFDSLTRHIFDEKSDVPADELQARYDEAVETAANAVADWILRSGLSVLIASQMANPFENPIAFPAILGAKRLVEEENSRQFPVIFRHNYFRDDEGSRPRIKLWNDRHPLLVPNLTGTIHLVDGPANREIARRQYGIEANILPEWMRFPDSGEMLLCSKDGFDLKKFEKLMHEPKKKFRNHLKRRFGIPEDAFLILSPSRLNRNKRIDLVIKLMSMLKEKIDRGKDVRLLVLGEEKSAEFKTRWSGDAEETALALRQLAGELGIGDKVHFLGLVSHERTADNPFTVTDIMRSVDLVSQMSEEETFGRTYLEAIASGVPVAMTSFNYPGVNFGKVLPVYPYIYSGFNLFVRYPQEGGLNEGMIERMVKTLTNDELRMKMAYQNYCRAYFSALNETFAIGYFVYLLSNLTDSTA